MEKKFSTWSENWYREIKVFCNPDTVGLIRKEYYVGSKLTSNARIGPAIELKWGRGNFNSGTNLRS